MARRSRSKDPWTDGASAGEEGERVVRPVGEGAALPDRDEV